MTWRVKVRRRRMLARVGRPWQVVLVDGGRWRVLARRRTWTDAMIEAENTWSRLAADDQLVDQLLVTW